MVTGASSGLGRTLCYWYLNNGAKVVLIGRDRDELCEIGEAFPTQAMVVMLDLADDVQLHDMK